MIEFFLKYLHFFNNKTNSLITIWIKDSNKLTKGMSELVIIEEMKINTQEDTSVIAIIKAEN